MEHAINIEILYFMLIQCNLAIRLLYIRNKHPCSNLLQLKVAINPNFRAYNFIQSPGRWGETLICVIITIRPESNFISAPSKKCVDTAREKRASF